MAVALMHVGLHLDTTRSSGLDTMRSSGLDTMKSSGLSQSSGLDAHVGLIVSEVARHVQK